MSAPLAELWCSFQRVAVLEDSAGFEPASSSASTSIVYGTHPAYSTSELQWHIRAEAAMGYAARAARLLHPRISALCRYTVVVIALHKRPASRMGATQRQILYTAHRATDGPATRSAPLHLGGWLQLSKLSLSPRSTGYQVSSRIRFIPRPSLLSWHRRG